MQNISMVLGMISQQMITWLFQCSLIHHTLSLRVNTWKEIEFFHYTNPCEDKPNAGVLYNGAIHWLTYRHDLQKDVIVAFDLMERKLLDVYLPDEFRDTLDYCSLWVFGKLLSFSAIDYGNNRDEIWVMKEYKVHSSWTKTHFLSIYGTPNESFSPLCCTKSGDIIGTDHDAGLVKYNDKGQLLEHRSYSCEFEVAVYMQGLCFHSLVKVNKPKKKE